MLNKLQPHTLVYLVAGTVIYISNYNTIPKYNNLPPPHYSREAAILLRARTKQSNKLWRCALAAPEVGASQRSQLSGRASSATLVLLLHCIQAASQLRDITLHPSLKPPKASSSRLSPNSPPSFRPQRSRHRSKDPSQALLQ